MIGQRVQLSPHLDRWMMGDRYGVIIAKGRNMGSFPIGNVWRVKLDVSGQVRRYHENDLTPV